MELGRIERIQAVLPVASNATAADVTPTFAVEAPDRMADDSYSANPQQQDRGMEGQEADEVPDTSEETMASEESPSSPGKKVNFFA